MSGEQLYTITGTELKHVREFLGSIINPKTHYQKDQLQMANTVIENNKITASRILDIITATEQGAFV